MALIDWLTASAILSTIIFLGSGLYSLRQQAYHIRASWLAHMYASLGMLWSLQQVLRASRLFNTLDPGFQERLPLYGLVLMTLAFLLLTRWVFGVTSPHWPWWLASLASVALPIALEMQFPGAEKVILAGLWFNRGGLITGVLATVCGILTAAAIWYMARSRRKTSRYHTLVPYWIVVLAQVVLGTGLYFASLRVPGIWLITTGGGLAVVLAAAPRLPELTHILRKVLSRALLVIIGILAYAALFGLTHLLLRGPFDDQTPVIALAAAILAMLLVDPLIIRLRRQLKRWTVGEHQNSAEVLRQYSQSITNILDLNLLATVAVATASEFLDVKRGFIFLVDHEKGPGGHNRFIVRGVKGMGETNPVPGHIREDSPLANFFRYEYKPITQVEISSQARFKGLYDEELAWLEQIGADVMVPIYAKNEWIGLLALGSKGSGREYAEKELDLLSTIADQTAVALENVRLVEGLVRLNNDFRRAYAALDQAHRNLERLDKTKSDFISISSHELRTPLTLISGSSQMLMDDPDLQQNPYYKQLLSKMHAGTVRLHEIVETMLDVAKIDTRALELEPQPVSLSNLVQAVCNDLRKDLEERHQTLDVQNLEDLPSITADVQALRKVFYHLLINAIKYTPDQGKITISGQAIPPNSSDLRHGGIEVVISDTGIGIDPRFHELIFTKFYQTGELALHSTGKTKFKGGGPGLGLAIARGIVEAHRGKIWVESPGYSEENCPGSSFHLVLPLRPV